jgi:hypothetical protein
MNDHLAAAAEAMRQPYRSIANRSRSGMVWSAFARVGFILATSARAGVPWTRDGTDAGAFVVAADAAMHDDKRGIHGGITAPRPTKPLDMS